jgi:hypothetical protein
MSPEDQHNISLQIAATEARMETRQSEIRGELAAINEWLTGRDHLYDAGFAAIDARFLSIEQAIRDLAHAISRLRTTVIVTAISVGLTTTLGVAAINATLLSGMVTSFDSGRDIGAAHSQMQQQIANATTSNAEMQRQIADINATLKRMEARQASAVRPAAK